MICSPAILYLIYGGIHVGIDWYKGLSNLAIIETCITFIFTLVLQFLCSLGLGIFSWILISIPFLFMALITSLVANALEQSSSTIIKIPKKIPYNVPIFYGSLGTGPRPASSIHPPRPTQTNNVVEPHSNHSPHPKYNPYRDGIFVDHEGIPINEISYEHA